MFYTGVLCSTRVSYVLHGCPMFSTGVLCSTRVSYVLNELSSSPEQFAGVYCILIHSEKFCTCFVYIYKEEFCLKSAIPLAGLSLVDHA
jgi:hypothetical protein